MRVKGICRNRRKPWRLALDRGYSGFMVKIRRSKATNSGRRDASAETVPSLMTFVAPPSDGLSEQGRHWQRENRAAIDCYNEWIAEQGLPLEEFRRF
jgi:hypothetical protein